MEKYGNFNNGFRHGDNGRVAALKRLEGIAGLIEEIRKIFKAPSLSIGVNYKGEKLWVKGFGLANEEIGLVPNSQTVYSIGSCTKGFTGTALSLLAQRGVVDLDAPVSSKIPSLKTKGNPVVAEQMTIRDMLSHCAGLSTMPFEVLGKDGHVFVKHEDIVQVVNHLPREANFKTEWMYSNWMYALAGTLIAQESKTSYGQFVQKEIFDKIGMKRTYTDLPTDGNHALPYLVFDDKPSKSVGLPRLNNGIAFDSSGSVRSCVDDLLLWSKALMQSWRQANPSRHHYRNQAQLVTAEPEPGCLTVITHFLSGLAKWVKNIYHHRRRVHCESDLAISMATAQTPYFPLSGDSNQQYALGLFNLHLPTTEMNVVTNPDVNDRHYSIGKDSGDRLVIGHTGELGGFLSAYWTFPDDDCSIVVLTNSFQINGDPTNIIAQLLTQTLFNLKPVVDFDEVAKNVVSNAKGRWDTVVTEWKKHRRAGTSPEPLAKYAGNYCNEGLAMTLSITLTGDSLNPLRLRINGIEEQVFDMYHYHANSWTFLQQTRDDCIENGYSMYLLFWKSWIIEFDHLESDKFVKIRWSLDGDSRIEPQEFLRQ
ncbi:beta-lactamase/transpeptidase-like protein [Mariannaea sp. PMI_226]|nr:beta-lactamase/transpeptidase-like protein [Mariannaea sp. PMI_226]